MIQFIIYHWWLFCLAMFIFICLGLLLTAIGTVESRKMFVGKKVLLFPIGILCYGMAIVSAIFFVVGLIADVITHLLLH